MFDDSETIIAHSDIAEVLPYLSDLHKGETVDAISKLAALVAAENKYAAYVLGSLFLFGKTPRYYIFTKSYDVGEVKRKSLIEIQEELGFKYWVGLLKLKGAEIEDFHLEGLYDLYKVMQGTAEFFTNNDIECRPQSDNHPMYKLFSSEHQLRDFLYRQNHPEVFLDVARDSLVSFSETQSEDDLNRALECLKKILNGDIFSRYSQYEIAHANLEVGKLYLYGNQYFKSDVRKAIAYLTESKLDKAYVVLLDYYKQYGTKYILSIRKCIGMISDDALRLKLYEENDLAPPAIVDIAESLNLLIGTQRKKTDISDYDLEGDIVIKVPKIVNESQVLSADAEIASEFQPIDLNEPDEYSDLMKVEPSDEANQSSDGDYLHSEDEYGSPQYGMDMDADFEVPYE